MVRADRAIDAFTDRKLEQYDLTEQDMAIVGFSQGTMMALHVGLRRTRPLAAILRYSGMLTGVPQLSRLPVSKAPVLLIHGDADPIVPVSALYSASRDLKQLGIAVTTHVSPGLDHSVDEAGLQLGRNFISDAFGKVKGT